MNDKAMKMQKAAACLLACFLMIGTLAAPVAARDDQDISRLLIEKARYWENKGRWETAEQTWKQLLLSEPRHREALLWLGIYSAERGDFKNADAYLTRLKEAGAPEVQVSALEDTKAIAPLDVKQLEKAREQAELRHYDDAAKAYRDLFRGKTPAGSKAMEFYRVLASTSNGWEEACRGMEVQSRVFPENPQVQFAYARHLSYRERTRREALSRLQALAEDRFVGDEAKKTWRQALLWLNARPADNHLFTEYLRLHGKDSEISAKIVRNQPQKPSSADLKLEKAYRLLDTGKLAEAEQLFLSLITDAPGNADAVAGLGILRLRQERFSEAEKYLAKATGLAPSKKSKWKESLHTARFWVLMESVAKHRSAGDSALAEKELRRALTLNPGEPSATLALADLLSEQGKDLEAEKLFRALLKENPDNLDARTGLAVLLEQQGKSREALEMLSSLPEDAPRVKDARQRLRIEQLKESARRHRAAGSLAEASRALEDAVVLDPDNPWVRFDLAETYKKQGRFYEARSIVDGLLVSHPNLPAVLYASALLSAEEDNPWEGLQLLEKIDPASRTGDMIALQRRLWVKVQAERAVVTARQGYAEQSRQILESAVAAAGDDEEFFGDLARAWAELGDHETALHLLRRNKSDDPGLRLLYVTILMETGQDVEAGLVLRQLMATAVPRELQQPIADLSIGLAVREASREREAGQYARAYDTLSPAIQAYGNDPRVRMELAALYLSAGDAGEALRIYDLLLSEDPEDREVLRGCIGAAMQIGEKGRAGDLIGHALTVHPQDPIFHSLAGRLARMEGRDRDAVGHFEDALALKRQAAPGSENEPAQVSAPPVLQLVGRKPALATPAEKPQANPFAAVIPLSTTSPSPAGMYSAPNIGYGSVPTSASVANPPAGRAWPMQNGGYRATGATPASRPAAPLAPRYASPASRPAAVPEAAYFSPGTAYNQANPTPRTPGSAPLSDEEELRELKSKYGPQWAGGITLRNRSGESGMSSLTDIETPLSYSINPGYAGNLTFKATTVLLDAGNISLRDKGKARRFGTNAVNLNLPQDREILQTDNGVALGVGYSAGPWEMDLGSTPLGFERTNLAGSLGWTPRLENGWLWLGIERRSVTDSLLSYAGAEDTATGEVWGGVMDTALALRGSRDLEDYGFYGSVEGGYLTGKNVEDNYRFKINAGVYYLLSRTESNEFKLDINVTGMGYKENLRYFTFGHGGYFSPQGYLGLSVPVTWTGRNKQLRYRLKAAPGLYHFQENAARYYPGDDDLQLLLEQAAASDAEIDTWYSGKSENSFGLNLSGEVEYGLGNSLFLGGAAGFDNARDYSEMFCNIYLRYWPQGNPRRHLEPPDPVEPYYPGEFN